MKLRFTDERRYCSERGGAAARVAAIAKKNTSKQKTDKAQQQGLALALQAEQELDSTPPQIALQLPLFPGEKSAMPHKWTRSSLFMSIAAGKRAKYVKTRLASRDDLVLLYTGEQLDMADNDVFLHALRLAQGRKAGEQIHFVRSQFLQAIGRSPGTTSYKWLKDSLQRIASASLFIENSDGDGKMFRLISELSWKRKNEEFWLALDPEIVQFFGKHELAHIDFQARLELKAPLAKWLQTTLAAIALATGTTSPSKIYVYGAAAVRCVTSCLKDAVYQKRLTRWSPPASLRSTSFTLLGPRQGATKRWCVGGGQATLLGGCRHTL